MTNKERMDAGLVYDPNDPALAGDQVEYLDKLWALATPCRVLRPIGEHDREYFYKNEKIDWENLT